MPVFRRHTEVLAEAVPFEGRRVLEVGCGDGRLLGWLAGKAALAVGLDPDLAQLARATASAGAGLLVRATGERLPFATAAFDLVVCFNSLHHVPADRQDEALAETWRVLRAGGDLLVAEPLAEGTWFEFLRPLEDETEVRDRAQAALRAARRAGLFEAVAETTYLSRIVVASLSAAIDRLVAADPARAARRASTLPELERRFAMLAEPVGPGFAFAQPIRLDHLRKGLA
jgi:SAM-dependent methyltransferase